MSSNNIENDQTHRLLPQYIEFKTFLKEYAKKLELLVITDVENFPSYKNQNITISRWECLKEVNDLKNYLDYFFNFDIKYNLYDNEIEFCNELENFKKFLLLCNFSVYT